MQTKPLLIGIDGGATKVSAWEIISNEQTGTFSLGGANSTQSYREFEGFIPDFVPVDLNTQLGERNTTINITQQENQQAVVYVEACAQAILAIVKQTGTGSVLVGIGMPGLKTADRRGIAVVANGPRMVRYSDMLEQRLKELGVQLAAPVSQLGSDADYCGIGENYSDAGLFRNCTDAYYLGGGTGVADAMKLNGELVTFDNAKEWIAKTWEMKSPQGLSLERFTSVGGIQKTYAELAGKPVEELNASGIYPIQISELAENGDAAAQKTFTIVNENLAMLLYDRIVTLYTGSQKLFDFVNPNRQQLNQQHAYTGKTFNRLIIGQRLGDLFEHQTGAEVVKKPVLTRLAELIRNSEFLSEEVKDHYKEPDQIVKTSRLREAPALGAGIDAFMSSR